MEVVYYLSTCSLALSLAWGHGNGSFVYLMGGWGKGGGTMQQQLHWCMLLA